jgi:hypothetical protein
VQRRSRRVAGRLGADEGGGEEAGVARLNRREDKASLRRAAAAAAARESDRSGRAGRTKGSASREVCRS